MTRSSSAREHRVKLPLKRSMASSYRIEFELPVVLQRLQNAEAIGASGGTRMGLKLYATLATTLNHIRGLVNPSAQYNIETADTFRFFVNTWLRVSVNDKGQPSKFTPGPRLPLYFPTRKIDIKVSALVAADLLEHLKERVTSFGGNNTRFTPDDMPQQFREDLEAGAIVKRILKSIPKQHGAMYHENNTGKWDTFDIGDDVFGLTLDDLLNCAYGGGVAMSTTNVHNSFNNSNNSNVNIGSDLTGAIQTVNASQSANKEELARLLEQLNTELGKVPVERKNEAEAVSALCKRCVEDGTKPQANQSLLNITKAGLVEAATALVTIAPSVLAVVNQILPLICR